MYGEGNQEALHGRILFPYLPLYIANIPAGMQLWQRGINESLYTDFPLSPLRLPGRLEGRTDSAEYVKP